jgi:hypothetical protein
LLFLDMMFSRGLVECLSRVSRGKPLRVDTDQRVSHRWPQHTSGSPAKLKPENQKALPIPPAYLGSRLAIKW